MNKKYTTHLSLEDRKNIELGIVEGLSKTQIAKKINRHPSTISKEIIKHRKLKPRNTFLMQIAFVFIWKTVIDVLENAKNIKNLLVLVEIETLVLVIIVITLVNAN